MPPSAERLPIYELRPALASALQQGRGARIVIEAPTGSGKSTQIPRMMINDGLAGDGQVVVLQPRRLAARMLARRVAQEQGCRLGDEVGYQVRFEKAVSAKTRIRYVTEGILLRELLLDPKLTGISAIIFDEFHERHLYGDITLARCLDVQATDRPDLSLLVMSATLETARLQDYMAPCEILRSEGRTFPVTISYSPPKVALKEEPWHHAARVCGEAIRGNDGHVLIFMPGSYEIWKTIEEVRRQKWARDFDVVPLHGELSVADQDRAVEESARRRIIVSTNVAETSLTIDGVTAVIDSGLARMAGFDVNRGINTLTIERISQASAQQRAGRAGRTAPGICHRLWSEATHSRRPMQELPEVLRMDLAEVALTLKAGGITDLDAFRWLEKPDAKGLAQALELLRQLGAIDPQTGVITPLGAVLVRHPVHPRHARVLVAAEEAGCVEPFALLLALMQGRSIFGKSGAAPPDEFVHGDEFSDLLPLLRAWEIARAVNFDRDECQRRGLNALAAREAGQLANQLLRQSRARSAGADDLTHETFAKVILTGFSDQLARRTNQGSLACDLPGGRRGSLQKESLVRKAPLVVATEVREVEGREVQVLLNGVTAVEEMWIEELFPDDYRVVNEALWDEPNRRVMQKEQTVFRDLVLSSRQSGEPDRAAAAAILAREVQAGNLTLKEWDDSVEQWITRLNCLARWMPDLEMPALGPEDRAFIIEQFCHGAVTYKDIKDKSPWNTLRGWLSAQQARWLDQYAPERLPLPGGRHAKVTYTDTGDPFIAARIQDLYGLETTPLLASGRIPVLVHILAPSHRPIQITRDLAGFWKNQYPKFKIELQRKYPRHVWK